MLSVLILGFLFVCQTTSLSDLTDDKPKSEDTKADLTRQLLNQETLIRMNLDRKVCDLMRDMADMKTKMTEMKIIMESNNKQLQEEIKEAKKEIFVLKHENGALKAELQLQSNESTVISVKETRVGFTAAVTSQSSSWQGDILVFPHVVTNTGYGYSTSTGKFTAPRAGTYVFFITVVSYRSNSLYLYIVHNGADKVGTMADGSAFQTGTNLAVLELRQGDTVWVRRYHGQGYITGSVPYTTFSGFPL